MSERMILFAEGEALHDFDGIHGAFAEFDGGSTASEPWSGLENTDRGFRLAVNGTADEEVRPADFPVRWCHRR